MISSDGDICMWPHNSQPGSRLVFYLPLSTMQEADCHFHIWKAFFSQTAKVAHDYVGFFFTHYLAIRRASFGLIVGLAFKCISFKMVHQKSLSQQTKILIIIFTMT